MPQALESCPEGLESKQSPPAMLAYSMSNVVRLLKADGLPHSAGKVPEMLVLTMVRFPKDKKLPSLAQLAGSVPAM